MFVTACRYPVATSDARDALAAGSGLVLATLVLLRIGRTLWPDALAVVALALAAVPAVLFAGLFGSALQADTNDSGPPQIGLTALPVGTGLTVVVLAGVYLAGPTVVLLGTVVALQNAASGGMGRTGVAIVGTSAMVLALVLGYALPAALAVVAALWFAYAHLAAARLVREGVTRATGRARDR